MPKEKVCGSCGKKFIKPGRTKARYCDQECFNKVQRIRLARMNKSTKFRNSNSGKNHHHWKGGRTVTARGYIWVRKPEHPDALSNGYIYEHRLVAEKRLGRRLEPNEVVHHINGIKTDNRPKNLIVLTQSAHMSKHNQDRK